MHKENQPEEISSKFNNQSDYFGLNYIVWAKIVGYPWWPAQIIKIPAPSDEKKIYTVQFITPKAEISYLASSKIKDFGLHYEKLKKVSQKYKLDDHEADEFEDSVKKASEYYQKFIDGDGDGDGQIEIQKSPKRLHQMVAEEQQISEDSLYEVQRWKINPEELQQKKEPLKKNQKSTEAQQISQALKRYGLKEFDDISESFNDLAEFQQHKVKINLVKKFDKFLRKKSMDIGFRRRISRYFVEKIVNEGLPYNPKNLVLIVKNINNFSIDVIRNNYKKWILF